MVVLSSLHSFCGSKWGPNTNIPAWLLKVGRPFHVSILQQWALCKWWIVEHPFFLWFDGPFFMWLERGPIHQNSRLARKALPCANLQQWALCKWWCVEPPLFLWFELGPYTTLPDLLLKVGRPFHVSNLQQWALCKWWFVEHPFFLWLKGPFFMWLERGPIHHNSRLARKALPCANLQKWALCKWWRVEPPLFLWFERGPTPHFQIGF
jgi:hypothetical protein